jgi:hypothetical protein
MAIGSHQRLRTESREARKLCGALFHLMPWQGIEHEFYAKTEKKNTPIHTSL